MTLTLSPTSGPPASSVQVTGLGLPRGTFQVTWDGSALGMPVVRVTGSGRASASVTVPSGAAAGTHLIAIAGQRASFSVTVVVVPTPTPTPPPTTTTPWTVAPPVGPFVTRDGGGTVMYGEQLRNNGGGAIQKLQVAHFTGYGIFNMDWQPDTTEPNARTLITDVIATDIAANPPRSMDGRGESGLWIGNPTDLDRAVAMRCAWMGAWTGAKCFDSILRNLRLGTVAEPLPGVGLYIEHVTKRLLLEYFSIVSLGTGINAEYWYGGEGSSDLTIRNGEVYCPADPTDSARAGMFFDAGTCGVKIDHVRFFGPGPAVIFPRVLADPSKPNFVDEASCVFENLGQHVSYHDRPMG